MNTNNNPNPTNFEAMLYVSVAKLNKLGYTNDQKLDTFIQTIDSGVRFAREDFESPLVQEEMKKNGLNMQDIDASREEADSMFKMMNLYAYQRDTSSRDNNLFKPMPTHADYLSKDPERLRTALSPFTGNTFSEWGMYKGNQLQSRKTVAKAVGLQGMDSRPDWQKSFTGRISRDSGGEGMRDALGGNLHTVNELTGLLTMGHARPNFGNLGELLPWTKKIIRYDAMGMPYMDKKHIAQQSHQSETAGIWNQPYRRSGIGNFGVGFSNLIPNLMSAPATGAEMNKTLGYYLSGRASQVGTQDDLRGSYFFQNIADVIRLPKSIQAENSRVFSGQNFWYQAGDAIGQVVSQILIAYATAGMGNLGSGLKGTTLVSKTIAKALNRNIIPYAWGGLMAQDALNDIFVESGVGAKDRLWMNAAVFATTTAVERFIGLEPAELYFKQGLQKGVQDIVKGNVRTAMQGASSNFKNAGIIALDETFKKTGIALKNIGSATAKEKQTFIQTFMSNLYKNALDTGQYGAISSFKRITGMTFGEGLEEVIEEFGHGFATQWYNHIRELEILNDPNREFVGDYDADKSFLKNYASEVFDLENQAANFVYGSIGGLGGAVINTSFRKLNEKHDPRVRSYEQSSLVQAILTDNKTKNDILREIDDMQFDLEITQEEAQVDFGEKFQGMNLNDVAKQLYKESVEIAFKYVEDLGLNKFKNMHPYLSNDINFLGRFLTEVRSLIYLDNQIQEMQKQFEKTNDKDIEAQLEEMTNTRALIKAEIDRYLTKANNNTSMSEKALEVTAALGIQRALILKNQGENITAFLKEQNMKDTVENRNAASNALAYLTTTSAMQQGAENLLSFKYYESIRQLVVPEIIESIKKGYETNSKIIVDAINRFTHQGISGQIQQIVNENYNPQDAKAFQNAVEELSLYIGDIRKQDAEIQEQIGYDEQRINTFEDTYNKIYDAVNEQGLAIDDDSIINLLEGLISDEKSKKQAVEKVLADNDIYSTVQEFENSDLKAILEDVFELTDIKTDKGYTELTYDGKYKINLIDNNADTLETLSYLMEYYLKEAQSLLYVGNDVTDDIAKISEAEKNLILVNQYLDALQNAVDVSEIFSTDDTLRKLFPQNTTTNEEGQRTYEEIMPFNQKVKEQFDAINESVKERHAEYSEAIRAKNLTRVISTQALSTKEALNVGMLWLNMLYNKEMKTLNEASNQFLGENGAKALVNHLSGLQGAVTSLLTLLSEAKSHVDVTNILADNIELRAEILKHSMFISSAINEMYQNSEAKEGVQKWIASVLSAFNRSFKSSNPSESNVFDSYFSNNQIYSFTDSQDINVNANDVTNKSIRATDLYNKAYHILVNMLHSAINVDAKVVDNIAHKITEGFTKESNYVAALDQILFSLDAFAVLNNKNDVDDFVLRTDIDIRQEKLAETTKDEKLVTVTQDIVKFTHSNQFPVLDTNETLHNFMKHAYGILGNAGTGKSMIMPGLLTIAYALMNGKSEVNVSYIALANNESSNQLGDEAKANIEKFIESYNKGTNNKVKVTVNVIDLQDVLNGKVDVKGDIVFIDEASKIDNLKPDNITSSNLKSKHFNTTINNPHASPLRVIMNLHDTLNKNETKVPMFMLTDNQQTYSTRETSRRAISNIFSHMMINKPLQYIFRASNNQVENIVQYYSKRIYSLLGKTISSEAPYNPPELTYIVKEGNKEGGEYFNDMNSFITEFNKSKSNNPSTIIVVALESDKINLLKKYDKQLTENDIYVLYNNLNDYKILGVQGLSKDNIFVYINTKNNSVEFARETLTAVTRSKKYVAIYDTQGKNNPDKSKYVEYGDTDKDTENIASSNAQMIRNAFAYARNENPNTKRKEQMPQETIEEEGDLPFDPLDPNEAPDYTTTETSETEAEQEAEANDDRIFEHEGIEQGDVILIKQGKNIVKREVEYFVPTKKGVIQVKVKGISSPLSLNAILSDFELEQQHNKEVSAIKETIRKNDEKKNNSPLAYGAVLFEDLQAFNTPREKSAAHVAQKAHTANVMSMITNAFADNNKNLIELLKRHKVNLKLEYKQIDVYNFPNDSKNNIFAFTLSVNVHALYNLLKDSDVESLLDNVTINSIEELVNRWIFEGKDYVQVGFLQEQAYNRTDLTKETDKAIEDDVSKINRLKKLQEYARQLNKNSLEIEVDQLGYFFKTEEKTVEFGETDEKFPVELVSGLNKNIPVIEGSATKTLDGSNFKLKKPIYLNTKRLYDILGTKKLESLKVEIEKILSKDSLETRMYDTTTFRLFKVVANSSVLASLVYGGTSASIGTVNKGNFSDVKMALTKLLDILTKDNLTEAEESILMNLYLPKYGDNKTEDMSNFKSSVFTIAPRMFFKNDLGDLFITPTEQTYVAKPPASKNITNKRLDIENIVNEIKSNKEFIKLKNDGSAYVNTETGKEYQRVTNFISNEIVGTNPLLTSSQIIGTKVDMLIRDFFAGELKNISEYFISTDNELLNFIEKLKEIKNNMEVRGEVVLANDILLYNDDIGVAGTVDLLTYDKEGNFRIYDMKTMRGNQFTDTHKSGYNIGKTKYENSYKEGQDSNKEKHQKQLSVYRILLANTHGIVATTIGIMPIEVSYNPGDETTSKLNLLKGVRINPLDKVKSAELKITKQQEITEDTIDEDFDADDIINRRDNIDNNYDTTTSQAIDIIEQWAGENNLDTTELFVQDLSHAGKIVSGLHNNGKIQLNIRGEFVNRKAVIHELYHMTMRHLITKDARRNVLNDYRAMRMQEGNNEVEYMTLDQLEEHSAYYTENIPDIVPQKRTLWQKIVDFVNKIVNFLLNKSSIRNPHTYNELISNIREGKYRNVDLINQKEEYLNPDYVQLRDDGDLEYEAEVETIQEKEAVVYESLNKMLGTTYESKTILNSVKTFLIAYTPWSQTGFSSYATATSVQEAGQMMQNQFKDVYNRIVKNDSNDVSVYKKEGDDYVEILSSVHALRVNSVFENKGIYYIQMKKKNGQVGYEKLSTYRYLAARFVPEQINPKTEETYSPIEQLINRVTTQQKANSKEAHVHRQRRDVDSVSDFSGVGFRNILDHLEVRQFGFKYLNKEERWIVQSIRPLISRRHLDNNTLHEFANVISGVAKSYDLTKMFEDGNVNEYLFEEMMNSVYELVLSYAQDSSGQTKVERDAGVPANYKQNTLGTLYDYIYGIYKGSEIQKNVINDLDKTGVVRINDISEAPRNGYYILNGDTYNADSLYNRYKRSDTNDNAKKMIEDFFVAMINSYQDIVNNNFVKIKDGQIEATSGNTVDALKNVMKGRLRNRVFQGGSYRRSVLNNFNAQYSGVYYRGMYKNNMSQMQFHNGKDIHVLVEQLLDSKNTKEKGFFIPYTDTNINEQASLIQNYLQKLHIHLPYTYIIQLISTKAHDTFAKEILRNGANANVSLSNYVLGNFIAASSLSLQFAYVVNEIRRESPNINLTENNNLINQIQDLIYQNSKNEIETEEKLKSKIVAITNKMVGVGDYINSLINTSLQFRQAAFAFRGLDYVNSITDISENEELLDNISDNAKIKHTPGPHHFDIALDLLARGMMNQSAKTTAAWVNGQMYQHQSKAGTGSTELQRLIEKPRMYKGDVNRTSGNVNNSLRENPLIKSLFEITKRHRVLSQSKYRFSTTKLKPVDIMLNGFLATLDSLYTGEGTIDVPAMMYGESEDLYLYRIKDSDVGVFVSYAKKLMKSYLDSGSKINPVSREEFLREYANIIKAQFRTNHIEHQKSVKRLHDGLLASMAVLKSQGVKFTDVNLLTFAKSFNYNDDISKIGVLKPLLKNNNVRNQQQLDEGITEYNFYGAIEFLQNVINGFVNDVNKSSSIDPYDVLISKGVASTIDIIKSKDKITLGNALGQMIEINDKVSINENTRYKTRNSDRFNGAVLYKHRNFFYQNEQYDKPLPSGTINKSFENIATSNDKSVLEILSNHNKVDELAILKLMTRLYSKETENYSKYIHGILKFTKLFDEKIQGKLEKLLSFNNNKANEKVNAVWNTDVIRRATDIDSLNEHVNWGLLSYWGLYQAVNSAAGHVMYGHNFNFKNPADQRARTQQSNTPGTGFTPRVTGLGNNITQVFMQDIMLKETINKLQSIGSKVSMKEITETFESTDGMVWLPAITNKRMVDSNGSELSIMRSTMGKPVIYSHNAKTGDLSINKYAHYAVSGYDVHTNGEHYLAPDVIALQIFDKNNGTQLADEFLQVYKFAKESNNKSVAFDIAVNHVNASITRIAKTNFAALDSLTMFPYSSTQKGPKKGVNMFNMETLTHFEDNVNAINSGQEYEQQFDVDIEGIAQNTIPTKDMKIIYDASHDFTDSKNTIFSQLVKDMYSNQSTEDAMAFDNLIANVMRTALYNIGIRENQTIDYAKAKETVREVIKRIADGFKMQNTVVGALEELVIESLNHSSLITHPQLLEKLKQTFSSELKKHTGKMGIKGGHYVQASDDSVIVYEMTLTQGDYVTTTVGSKLNYDLMKKDANRLGATLTVKARKLNKIQKTEDGYTKGEAMLQTVNQSEFGVKYGESMYDYTFFEMKLTNGKIVMINIDDIDAEGNYLLNGKKENLFWNKGRMLKHTVERGNLILNAQKAGKNILQTINNFKQQRDVLVVRKPTPTMSSSAWLSQVEFRFDNVAMLSAKNISWNDSDFDIDALYGYEYEFIDNMEKGLKKDIAILKNTILDMVDNMFVKNNHLINQSLSTDILKEQIKTPVYGNYYTPYTDVLNTRNMTTGMNSVGIYANILSVAKNIQFLKNHPDKKLIINENANIGNKRFQQIVNKIFESGYSEEAFNNVARTALYLQASIDNLKNPMLGQMGIELTSINEIAAMVLYGLSEADIINMYQIQEIQFMQVLNEYGQQFYSSQGYSDAFTYFTKRIMKETKGQMFFTLPNIEQIAEQVINKIWATEERFVYTLQKHLPENLRNDKATVTRLLQSYLSDRYMDYKNVDSVMNDDKFIDQFDEWINRLKDVGLSIETILSNADIISDSPQTFYANMKVISNLRYKLYQTRNSFASAENQQELIADLEKRIQFMEERYKLRMYNEMQAFAMAGKILTTMSFLEDITDGPNSKSDRVKAQIDAVSMALGRSLLETPLSDKGSLLLEHRAETVDDLVQYYKESDTYYNKSDAETRKILEYQMRETFELFKIGNIFQLQDSYLASAEVLLGYTDVLGISSVLANRVFSVLQEHLSRAIGIGATGNVSQYFAIRTKMQNFYLGEVLKKYMNRDDSILRDVSLQFTRIIEGVPIENELNNTFKELDLRTEKGREMFVKLVPDYIYNLKDILTRYVNDENRNQSAEKTLLNRDYQISDTELDSIYEMYLDKGQTFVDVIDLIGNSNSARLAIANLHNLKNQPNLYNSTKDLFKVVPETIMEILGVYEVMLNKFAISSASLFDMIGVEYFKRLLGQGAIQLDDFMVELDSIENKMQMLKELGTDDRIMYAKDKGNVEAIIDDVINLADKYSEGIAYMKLNVIKEDRHLTNNNKHALYLQETNTLKADNKANIQGTPYFQTGTVNSFTEIFGQNSVLNSFPIRNLSTEEMNDLINDKSVTKYFAFEHGYRRTINEDVTIFIANRIVNVTISVGTNYITMTKINESATLIGKQQLSASITNEQKLQIKTFNDALKHAKEQVSKSAEKRTIQSIADNNKPIKLIEDRVILETIGGIKYNKNLHQLINDNRSAEYLILRSNELNNADLSKNGYYWVDNPEGNNSILVQIENIVRINPRVTKGVSNFHELSTDDKKEILSKTITREFKTEDLIDSKFKKLPGYIVKYRIVNESEYGNETNAINSISQGDITMVEYLNKNNTSIPILFAKENNNLLKSTNDVLESQGITNINSLSDDSPTIVSLPDSGKDIVFAKLFKDENKLISNFGEVIKQIINFANNNSTKSYVLSLDDFIKDNSGKLKAGNETADFINNMRELSQVNNITLINSNVSNVGVLAISNTINGIANDLSKKVVC